MKILWLNAGLLLPLDKGGKLRTWHLMRHLAARHDITYLSFTEPSEREDYRTGMREVCRRLETFPGPIPPRERQVLRLCGALSRDPVSYARQYRSPASPRGSGSCGTEAFDAVSATSFRAREHPAHLPCRPSSSRTSRG